MNLLSHPQLWRGFFILVMFLPKSHVAQEQWAPPTNWSYRVEYATNIQAVTAAKGNTYIAGQQTGPTTTYTTIYDPNQHKTIPTKTQPWEWKATGTKTRWFLQSLDPQGKVTWRNTWDIASNSKNTFDLQNLVVDQGNNLHLMGQFSGRMDFNPDGEQVFIERSLKDVSMLYLMQFNQQGEVIALNTYNPEDLDASSTVISLALDQQQSYLYVLQDNGSYSKLTLTGDLVWSKKVLEDNHYEAFSLEPSDIAVDAQDYLYILRYSDYHNEEGEYDEKTFSVPSSILKITPNGDKVWESALHTNSPSSFVVDKKGQIYWWSALLSTRWTGTEQEFKVYKEATLLLGKINEDGRQSWQKRFLADDFTTASAITLVNDEELYATTAQKKYLKTFGEAVATPSTTQEAMYKTIHIFDLEGKALWRYDLPFDQEQQDQLNLHYDPNTKHLLFWGHLSPDADIAPDAQQNFPAGYSSTQQLFQWSPILPRP